MLNKFFMHLLAVSTLFLRTVCSCYLPIYCLDYFGDFFFLELFLYFSCEPQCVADKGFAPHSIGCLLTLSVVSFAVQKFWTFLPTLSFISALAIIS